MKRFTMTVALLLIVAMSMRAEHITPETAQKVAKTFLNNNGTKAAQLTDLSKEAGFPNLYIFTAEQGFVVMSADDCVQPILGYSLTGIFQVKNIPTNVHGWLQGYNDEIQYAVDNQVKAGAETTKLWKDLMDGNSKAAKTDVVVSPLIQTKWNQNKYYNNLCPAVSDGPDGHAYTGCVATAMAQVMKYWEYPSHGIGSHSYTWNGQNLNADFGTTNYDWDNMTDYYEYYFDDGLGNAIWLPANFHTPERVAAVATLMYHCGVSVNMNYGGQSTGGSTANSFVVAAVLKNYFNYDSAIEYKTKSSDETTYYTDEQWIAMVKAELNANRPLYYCGLDPNSNNGHAFVCDGYDNRNYFHFNWGWAGHYDGYFSINNLNTGANSSQAGAGNGVYTRNQSAVFGIRPSQCTATEPTSLTYNLSGLQNLTLNWTASNGAVSYNIYRNGNHIGNSTTNSYSEIAPFGNNTYYVRSVDANGNLSLSSNTVSVYIGYQTPVVDDLEASLSGNNVNLTWTAPEWCYPETPSATLNYGNGNPYYSWTCTYYAHRHLASNLAQYTGKAVYKVSTFIQYPGTYSVYIYTKSTSANRPDPSHLAFSDTGIPITVSNEWYEFDMANPIILTGTDDLWVVIKQENTGQTYPTPSFNTTTHNTNAFYAGDSPTSLFDANSSYNCAWFINTYLTDGVYTYNLYRNGSPLRLNWTATSYTDQNRNNTVSFYTIKTNYYGGVTDASNGVGYTLGQASTNSLTLNANDKMTVTAGSKLTVSGIVSDMNPGNLILENGAQLIHNSPNVQATVKKQISGYGNDDGKWHFISTPISEGTATSDITTGNYDLYSYDDSIQYWINEKATDNNFNILNNAHGYLYANQEDITLDFSGCLRPSNTGISVPINFNGNTIASFSLVGNPFPCNAYINRDYYVMYEDGTGINPVAVPATTPIPPCTAVMVKAENKGETVVFTREAVMRKK